MSLLPDHFWSTISWNFLNLAERLDVKDTTAGVIMSSYLIMIMPQMAMKANRIEDENVSKAVRCDVMETFAVSLYALPIQEVEFLIKSHHSLLDVCWQLLQCPVQKPLTRVFRIIGQFLSYEERESSTKVMKLIQEQELDARIEAGLADCSHEGRLDLLYCL